MKKVNTFLFAAAGLIAGICAGISLKEYIEGHLLNAIYFLILVIGNALAVFQYKNH
jgi:phage shock protein PspC (stress-responsive transcriptional regulator)